MNSSKPIVEHELLRTYAQARKRNTPLQLFLLVTICGVTAYLRPQWQTGIFLFAGICITRAAWLLYGRLLSKPLTAVTYKKWLAAMIVLRVTIAIMLSSLFFWAWNPDMPAGNLMLVLLVALQIPLSAMSGSVVLPIFYSEQSISAIAVACGAWILTAQWGHPEVMVPVGYFLLASMTFPIRIDQTTREMLGLQYGLQEASLAAEAASLAKSSFLSTMSHEIRTPLNSIIGMNSLLLDSPLTADQYKYALAAKNAGGHLLHLINDILDFSKLEAGRVELEMIDFDITREMESAISILGVEANTKGIALTYEIRDGVPPVLRGDLARLRQVFFNLVANAVKFTEYGSVRLVVSRQFSNEAGKVSLRAEIIDTGVGIPPEKISHLFHDFTQADTSTTRRFGGTGLGLAICKRLVELMSGEIGVENNPGGGSTFWFTAPLEIGSLDELDAGQETMTANGPGTNTAALRVLVAEDNPSNQLLISILLEKLDCVCTIAKNGLEALDAIQSGRQYDLVLMDMQMPVMDGIDATIAIRALPDDVSRIPIIALTADAIGGVREKVIAAGMNDYLSKPIDVPALARALAHWGNVSRQQSLYSAPETGNAVQSQPALIDESVLSSMTEVLGKDKAAELMDEFWPTVEAKLAEMRRALGAPDLNRVHALAHELKGSAANFGGSRIAEIAGLLQQDSGDPGRASQHIDSISKAVPETRNKAVAFIRAGRAA